MSTELEQTLGKLARETKNTLIAFNARIIRAGYAKAYAGMSERVFNRAIRPFLREIEIGEQGVGFDRVELDRVLEQYIESHSTPAKEVFSARLADTESLKTEKLKSVEECEAALQKIKG